MPYIGSRNAVIAMLEIAGLLDTSLGAQGSVKLTGQADGCQSDSPVRRKLLGQTNALTTVRSTASDEGF
jgi:hypothetical protein